MLCLVCNQCFISCNLNDVDFSSLSGRILATEGLAVGVAAAASEVATGAKGATAPAAEGAAATAESGIAADARAMTGRGTEEETETGIRTRVRTKQRKKGM